MKWMKLRTKFWELGQELPPPAFFTKEEPKPSNNQPMLSKTVHSHHSEFRQPTPVTRNEK